MRGERDRERESERKSKILVKSFKPRDKAQTKVDHTKLSLEIITRNYRYYINDAENVGIIGILAYPKKC